MESAENEGMGDSEGRLCASLREGVSEMNEWGKDPSSRLAAVFVRRVAYLRRERGTTYKEKKKGQAALLLKRRRREKVVGG